MCFFFFSFSIYLFGIFAGRLNSFDTRIQRCDITSNITYVLVNLFRKNTVLLLLIHSMILQNENLQRMLCGLIIESVNVTSQSS